MNHYRILIVGAGLAGLSLARALRQAGLAPQVIEREAGWGVAGTGIYLPANGVRALRTLGLEGAVAARGTRISRQRVLDHRGHLLAEIDLDRLWADVGPCLALPRTELHHILREGVPVQLGRTIRSLEHLDGPVQVGFDDGSGGDYDLVIGADGLRSSARRLAVDPRPPVPVGQHSWRFLAACPPHGMSPNMAQGAALAFEDALVLAACLRDAATVTDAVATFVARRSQRTGWVRSQTHRRDRTRNLPPVLRDLTLRAFGRRIFRSNYRPLREPI
jgi:2-polyprenyl-6-methoxyphenol hydroxylase-like FAD-dependent oxidoreductase